MKYYIVIFLLVFSPLSVAQNRPFSISADFGINYIFDYEGLPSDYLSSSFEIYRKVGYNISSSLYYSFYENNNVYISMGYIKSEIRTKGFNGQYNWIVQGYPISLGYQYNFYNNNSKIFPYISMSFSYFFSTSHFKKKEEEQDITDFYRSENGLGLEGGLGIYYKMNDDIYLSLQTKFRYANGSYLTEISRAGSLEFTGIYIDAGLKYNL